MPRNAAVLTAAMAIVLSTTLFAETPAATRPYELDDDGLNAAIAGLDIPAQRYASFRKLVLYSSRYPVAMGGMGISYKDPLIVPRSQRAGQAMEKAVDIPLIKKGLADPDETVQWWAIGAAGAALEKSRGNDARVAVTDPDALTLLPILRKLCTSDDESQRFRAQSALTWIVSEREFLQNILKDETSPVNVMHLLTATGLNADYPDKMNAHLMRLLNSTDPKIRASVLTFIARNSSMAPMFHLAFSTEVRDKVIALSAEATDSAASPAALSVLLADDPPRRLALLKEMSADKSPAVRKSAAEALYISDKIPEFHALLLGMINDSDDTVRFMATYAAGPESHIPELRVLAASKDKEVAERASALLKAIEDRNKPR